MTLVHNEQTKLTANAVNTAATSSLAIGALAPVAAALYGAGPSSGRGGYVFIGAVFWIAGALALHLLARQILKGLRS
jgi:tellurite resistance protein TehA-like permease